MSVVNVKVKHIRPRYEDLRDWMKDPNNVYIGRRGIVFIAGRRFPPEDSVWANPFKVGKDGTRKEVIAKYKSYINQELSHSPELRAELLKLKGKNLGC